MTRPAVWVLAIAFAALGSPTVRAVEDPPGPAPPVEPTPIAEAAQPAPAADPLSDRLNFTPNFKLRGRIDADAVMASQSAASRAQIGTVQNGYGLRRARLGAQGTVGDAADWVAEFEFAGGNVRLRDVYVGLTALPGVRQVNVGYFREPFSLEGATSARFITFMERSPLNELDPTRDWGICGYWWPDSERMTYAIGAFRTGTDSGGFSGEGGHWAVTTRVTGLPVYEDSSDRFRLVHLGGAFSQRHPANDVVQYDPNSQSNLLVITDTPVSPFLPTVDVPSNSQQLYNLQAAWVNGPRSIQAEWFGTTIQQIGGGMVYLHGSYVYGSYFLTGEHRGYNKTRAGFDQVHVLRPLVRSGKTPGTGCGAVELATRFAVANFSSPNLPIPPTSGAATAPNNTIFYEWTLGANWYLNDYVRLMANYTLSIPATVGQPVLPVNGFNFRTAIFW